MYTFFPSDNDELEGDKIKGEKVEREQICEWEQIINNMNERQAVTPLIQTIQIGKRIIRNFYEQFYANKSDNMETEYEYLEK